MSLWLSGIEGLKGFCARVERDWRGFAVEAGQRWRFGAALGLCLFIGDPFGYAEGYQVNGARDGSTRSLPEGVGRSRVD